MKWIQDDTGPFVFLPKNIAKFWNRGNARDYEFSTIYEGFFNTHYWNLYRVFFIKAEGQKLTWLDDGENTGGYLICWVDAPEHIADDIIVKKVLKADSWDEEFEFECNTLQEDYVVFPAMGRYPTDEQKSLELHFADDNYTVSVCNNLNFIFGGQEVTFAVVRFQKREVPPLKFDL